VFILTEHTPNPDALKFIPDAKLTDGASRWCDTPESSPLAARLFGLAGVRRVFIAPEFVTVTRAPDGPAWAELRYQVIAAIADHLAAGAPVLDDAAASPDPPDDEDEVIADIRQVLGRYVRPGVARDGGDVVLDRFDPETGVVWVRMHGACGGCPSSRMTLKATVEQLLRRYVPEVQRVEEVRAEPAAAAEPPAARWARQAKAAGEGPLGRARTLFTHAGREIRKEDA
jgi:Fe-S cluster biogenesis protein NfuA